MLASTLIGALALSLSTSPAVVHAQGNEQGLLSALQTAGLTSFAQLLQSDALASTRQSLASGTSGTIFAPPNAALTAAVAALPNLSQTLVDTINYHVLEGSFPASAISSNGDSVARTYLKDGTNLPGGQNQVMVFGKLANGTVQIRQGLSNATVTASATYQNVVIHSIGSLLSVPASLSATATAAGLTSLALTLENVIPGLISSLQTIPGITVFAPVNAAFTDLPGLLSSLPSATIQNVLSAHVLNGTTVYTPSMTTGSRVIAASGAQLGFVTNSTGTFIQAENSTVQVLIPDVPISNGVVHVISNVLISTTADNAAAQQAIASRSSEAATATGSQTGLIAQTLATSIAPASSPAARSGVEALMPCWDRAVSATVFSGIMALML